MLTTIAIGLLSAVTMVPQTDTLVILQGETRLELELWAGEVVVQTWDRDAVQISAEHSDRIGIETSHSGNVLKIEMDMRRGFRPLPVDFQLTVPRGMDLEIGGMSISVSIEGSEGNVEIASVNGDIEIHGGKGDIIAPEKCPEGSNNGPHRGDRRVPAGDHHQRHGRDRSRDGGRSLEARECERQVHRGWNRGRHALLRRRDPGRRAVLH